jgi:hypothetical protein
MTHKVRIRRLPTGVPGLNPVLDGVLPEFSFNLIAGSPGTGKTTLAHQLMFGMASPERRALFFSALGEPALKMMRYQQHYAFFDIDKVESSIRFVIKRYVCLRLPIAASLSASPCTSTRGFWAGGLRRAAHRIAFHNQKGLE